MDIPLWVIPLLGNRSLQGIPGHFPTGVNRVPPLPPEGRTQRTTRVRGDPDWDRDKRGCGCTYITPVVTLEYSHSGFNRQDSSFQVTPCDPTNVDRPPKEVRSHRFSLLTLFFLPVSILESEGTFGDDIWGWGVCLEVGRN